MKRSYIFCCVILILLISAMAGAEDKTYIIGVENIDYLPHYTGENNQFAGFSRVLLDAFAKKMNYRFIYKPLPLRRLFSEFLDKKTDFKYPDNPNWSADLKKGITIRYSTRVVGAVTGVMVLPEKRTTGPEEFRELGTMMGFTPTAYTELIEAGKIRKTEAGATDFSSLLKMALMKRVDGVYLAIDVGAYHLREILKKPGALVFNPNLPYDVQEYSLSSLKYPEIISEFDTFLTEEKAFVDKLKQEHHITEYR